MSKKSFSTKHKEIADYWEDKVYEGDFNFDFAEALEVCWNCGYEKKTERCHIIPQALGGPDTPDNFVLLCGECHRIAPNCNDKNVMWDWLRSNKTVYGAYNTYHIEKGMEMYNKMYEEPLFDALVSLGWSDKEIMDEFRSWYDENRASHHFGVGHLSSSTYAGLLKGFVEHCKKKNAHLDEAQFQGVAC